MSRFVAALTRESLALCVFCLLPCVACAPRLTVREIRLDGTFGGRTEAGEPVVMTFVEESEAFRGLGTIDGEEAVVAGPVVWRGVGALERGSGRARPVEVELSADGDRLELIVADGAERILLERDADVAPAAGGPFAGRYRGFRDGDLVATATLVQSAELLAGVGILLDEAFGVSASTDGAGAADGYVTFADGTRVRFSATLGPEGETLEVRGLGGPLEWRREGSR